MVNIEKCLFQKLNKEQLIKKLSEIAEKSNCKLRHKEGVNQWTPYDTFEVAVNDKTTIIVHAILKNISGAGWSDKPEIKRIQIRQLPTISRQTKNEFFILCGFCNYDSQTILAVWDPMNYQTHRTCCSCYVFVSSFEKAINLGLYSGLNKGKEVIVCNESGFGDLILELSSRYL